eukprot:gene12775-biopygen3462
MAVSIFFWLVVARAWRGHVLFPPGRNGHARVRSAPVPLNPIVRPASGPRPVRVRCRFPLPGDSGGLRGSGGAAHGRGSGSLWTSSPNGLLVELAALAALAGHATLATLAGELINWTPGVEAPSIP